MRPASARNSAIQGLDVGVLDLTQDRLDLVEHGRDVLGRAGQVVLQPDLARLHGLDRVDHDLEAVLVQLALALHMDKPGSGDRRIDRLGSLPHPSVDLAGPVGQIQGDVQITSRGAPEHGLLGQVDVVHDLAGFDLVDEHVRHSGLRLHAGHPGQARSCCDEERGSAPIAAIIGGVPRRDNLDFGMSCA